MECGKAPSLRKAHSLKIEMSTRNERIAKRLYDEIERIQNESVYVGQVQQSSEAVEHEFIEQVVKILEQTK